MRLYPKPKSLVFVYDYTYHIYSFKNCKNIKKIAYQINKTALNKTALCAVNIKLFTLHRAHQIKYNKVRNLDTFAQIRPCSM